MNPTTEEFPIHLVAECGDPSNVAALLEHGSTKIYIDQDYQHDTALLMLFRSIDATNFESHFACIKLLLAHGADINMTNDLNLPPIVCESLSSLEPAQQDQVIAHCLDKVTFYARGDYGRRMLVKTFGEGRLPPGSCPDYGAESVTVGQLRSWLFDGKEDEFLANYRKVPAINGNFKCQIVKEFLLICVKKGYEMTLKVLMEENLSDLAQYRSKLLEQCSIYGNDRIIPLLTVDTERTSQNGGLLLSIIPLIEVDSDECAHYRCAKLILQNPLTELDREDGIGHTALHYAVRYNLSNVQEMLLQRGAYIGAKNRYDELPIAEMDPTELEAHLDSCVTCKSVIIGDKQYEIDVDLKNFVPPIHKVRDQEHKNGTGNVHAPENDEMRCVIELGKMANMKHLLQHPVVLTILLEKFGKLRWFLLANLLVCFCFYAISVLTLAFDVGTFQGMANTLLLALFALMFIRDGLILGSNWRRVDVYKSLLTVCHVCLNCILLGAPIAFPSILRYRWIPAFIILWRAAQLTVLLGTLSSIVEEAELISIAKTASVIHEYEHLETFYIGGSSLWLK
ncbi:hypothetical protein ZHAS_00007884 [Anopheles sinensis]|uniref:Ion transport domain-containing protein n=1 Tax=Anopheles sinensis TaxID=74873 RepID=A0A084VR07_ANOSI|nr:hypothetical protein ZHAS_00007884 [Anopheles sinensis]